MISVERLKHDADYWDEVAPDEATHYCPECEPDWVEGWYKEHEGGAFQFMASYSDKWQKDFFVPTAKNPMNPASIPRPTRKQWSGPEDGLPPVGSKVEGYINYGASSRWREVEVLKHNNEEAAVFCANGGCGFLAWCTEFRPLKSEKERVVEAVIRKMGWTNSVESVLKDLYDAGALKMPEEDQ